MAPKMVASFRRSLSFSSHIPSCSSSKPPEKAYHVRSVSLPCRSHPLISQLRDEISELKTWASKHDARASAWLCDGLTQLKIVQESLDDLLQLPQTPEFLRRYNQGGLIEKFLDDFLWFLDVYGIFQTLILTLKEQHFAAQVAVRRKDDCKMSLHLKNFRKMGKEFGHLASSLQSMGKFKSYPPPDGQTRTVVVQENVEIVQVIRDVIELTALVSVALFNGLSVSLASRKPSCLKFSLKSSAKIINAKKIVMVQQQEGIQEFEEMGLESLRKKDEEELRWTSKRMRELEGCIGGIENGSERVFRSLFNTRVSSMFSQLCRN